MLFKYAWLGKGVVEIRLDSYTLLPQRGFL